MDLIPWWLLSLRITSLRSNFSEDYFPRELLPLLRLAFPYPHTVQRLWASWARSREWDVRWWHWSSCSVEPYWLYLSTIFSEHYFPQALVTLKPDWMGHRQQLNLIMDMEGVYLWTSFLEDCFPWGLVSLRSNFSEDYFPRELLPPLRLAFPYPHIVQRLWASWARSRERDVVRWRWGPCSVEPFEPEACPGCGND